MGSENGVVNPGRPYVVISLSAIFAALTTLFLTMGYFDNRIKNEREELKETYERLMEQQTVDHLQAVALIEKDLDNSRRKVEEQVAQIDKLELALQEQKELLASLLTGDLSSQQEKIVLLVQDLKELKALADDLKDENENYQEESNRLKWGLARSNAKNDSLTARIEHLSKSVETFVLGLEYLEEGLSEERAFHSVSGRREKKFHKENAIAAFRKSYAQGVPIAADYLERLGSPVSINLSSR